jgi:transposase
VAPEEAQAAVDAATEQVIQQGGTIHEEGRWDATEAALDGTGTEVLVVRHFRVACRVWVNTPEAIPASGERAVKKYKVSLTDEERESLQELIAAGKASAKKLGHARVLLKADAAEGGPAWPDARIAEAVELSIATVERIRRRFIEEGFEAALVRKKQDRPSRSRTLDGVAEARLVTLACSAPPEGRARWTMQLLADELVELRVVDSVSDETVRRTLQKTRSSRGRGSSGAARRGPTPSS